MTEAANFQNKKVAQTCSFFAGGGQISYLVVNAYSNRFYFAGSFLDTTLDYRQASTEYINYERGKNYLAISAFQNLTQQRYWDDDNPVYVSKTSRWQCLLF